MIFVRKMPEFYIIIARKIFFPDFRGARAHPCPPVSYEYSVSALFVLFVRRACARAPGNIVKAVRTLATRLQIKQNFIRLAGNLLSGFCPMVRHWTYLKGTWPGFSGG